LALSHLLKTAGVKRVYEHDYRCFHDVARVPICIVVSLFTAA
jgi:hypothetical protein